MSAEMGLSKRLRPAMMEISTMEMDAPRTVRLRYAVEMVALTQKRNVMTGTSITKTGAPRTVRLKLVVPRALRRCRMDAVRQLLVAQTAVEIMGYALM